MALLIKCQKDITLKYPQWEWADVSQGQLVYAEHGRLMSAKLTQGAEGPSQPKLIHDFNDYTFEPIEAPY